MLNILIACEESGAVRDAFIAQGHNAVSCDILESSSGNDNPHIVGDALAAIRSQQWDVIIAFPPCTYLCSSGLHWNKRRPERAALTEAAFKFFMEIANADCQYIAIENPIGCVSSRWRKPDQIIQPYEFGHDASKRTCLWLKGLPVLERTQYVAPRMIDGKPRWGNQTDSGQNNLTPSPERAKLRSKTYAGIAAAMAQQWSDFLSTNLPTEPTMKKYLFTITLLDHSIEQTEAYCDCPIDWVVSNYHHDDMLDWSWIEIVGGEQ